MYIRSHGDVNTVTSLCEHWLFNITLSTNFLALRMPNTAWQAGPWLASDAAKLQIIVAGIAVQSLAYGIQSLLDLNDMM